MALCYEPPKVIKSLNVRQQPSKGSFSCEVYVNGTGRAVAEYIFFDKNRIEDIEKLVTKDITRLLSAGRAPVSVKRYGYEHNGRREETFT